MSLTAPAIPGFASALHSYLEASTVKYHGCLASLGSDRLLKNPTATLRFQHIRFDGNGRPKFIELARVLADHIVEYTFSTRRRASLNRPNEHARIYKEAAAYFRKFATSGEAGEILLYFLLEAVLGAPQLVAKMEMKTNPNVEINGSDGIHMKWDEADRTLDVFFGEAKLEKTVSSALTNMLRSLENFHRDGLLEFELGLVTSHYKHANDPIRAEILNIIDTAHPSNSCRINHACLIGYEWDQYQRLSGIELGKLESEFKTRYEADLSELTAAVEKRLSKFSRKEIRFEIFLLPFRTVQEFRDAFNKAI